MRVDENELAHLVRGANRIGEFFAANPDAAEARAGIAGHIQRYWAPALRQRLLQHLLDTGGDGLDPLVAEALRSLPG
jgi:formate dehydrogenase subunit delta